MKNTSRFGKRCFVFMVIGLLFCFSATGAWAAVTAVTVGGESVPNPSANYTGTNWTWTAGSSTLTLNGYTGGSISIGCAAADQVTLSNSGNNAVSATGANGIYCGGILTIDGSGTLTVTSDHDGISAEGTLTISSGTVNASTSGSGYKSAITGSGVSITGSATVTATASGASATGIMAQSGGTTTIDTTGTVTVTGYIPFSGSGNLLITSGTVNVSSTGVTGIAIAWGKTLTVGSGAILNNLAGTIYNNGTITNNGTINNNGTIDNTGGMITNTGAIYSNSATGITGTAPSGGTVQVKTVTVGTQSGTLTQGAPGNASFGMITTNIVAAAQSLTLIGTIPTGVTADSTVAISSNAGTFKIYTTTATPAGTYPLRVMIDSMISAQTFNLVVSSGSGGNPDPSTVSVTGVAISKTTLDLVTGESGQLSATVAPSDASNKNVTWSSSSPDVVSVDQNGKATAVGPGTATITATTVDGKKTATCTITVTDGTSPAPTEKSLFTMDVAGCEIVVTQNANGTLAVKVRIPFASGSNPALLDTVKMIANSLGLSNISYVWVDAQGKETPAARMTTAPYLEIRGTAANMNAIENGVITKIEYTLKDGGTTYVQTFPNGGLKVAGMSGYPTPTPTPSTGGGSSGGCDAGFGLFGLALGLGCVFRLRSAHEGRNGQK